MMYARTLLCAALLFVLSGCSDSSDGSCVPGQVQSCNCDDGSAGTQICLENGTLDTCLCEGGDGITYDDISYGDGFAQSDTFGTKDDASADVTLFPDLEEPDLEETPDVLPMEDILEDSVAEEDTWTASDAVIEEDLFVEPDVTEEPDIEEIPDTVEVEDIEEELDIVEPVDIEEEPDVNDEPTPSFVINGDCVDPVDQSNPVCEATDCEEDEQCVGYGVCVPKGVIILNTDIPNSQSKISIAPLPGGNFAGTWFQTDYTVPDPPIMDVYYRLYAPDGTALIDPVKVDEDTLKMARSPTITPMQNGNFLIAWRTQEAISSGEIRYMSRVITPEGTPLGNAIQLNQTPLIHGLTGNVDSPFPKLLRNATIGVAWAGKPAEDNGTAVNIYLRVLSEDGVPITDELETGGATQFNETSPTITDTTEGGLMLLWSYYQTGSPGKNGQPPVEVETLREVRGRIFDQLAVPLGDVFTASPGLHEFEGYPAVTTFPDGEYFLTWKGKELSDTPIDVYGHQLGVEGGFGFSEIHHPGGSPSGTYPYYAPVTAADQERAGIIWHSIPGADEAIFFRRYYLAPDMLECEPLNLSMGAPGTMPRLPTVIAFPEGYFLASWNAGTGSISKIYLRYVK